MRYRYLIFFVSALLFLGGCYSEPVYNGAAAGTDTVGGTVRPGVVGLPAGGGIYQDTIYASEANTYRFTATAEAMTLYVTGVDDTFTWRCLFDGEGELGGRTGESYCAFTGLTVGASYTFLLEETGGGPLAFLLRIMEDYGEGTRESPVKLVLGAENFREAEIGAYRDVNYYYFDGSTVANYYEVQVVTETSDLTSSLYRDANFSQLIVSCSSAASGGNFVCFSPRQEANATFYLTIANGADLYRDYAVRLRSSLDEPDPDSGIDDGDDEYSRTNPQPLEVGRKYTGLNADADGYHYFIATSSVHTITVFTTNLLWSLYGNSDFFSDLQWNCWTSDDQETRCLVRNLTVGKAYYLYVYNAFYPTDEPNYSVLIE